MAVAGLEPDDWAWWRPEDGFGGDDAGSTSQLIDTNNDAPLELLVASPDAWWAGVSAAPRIGEDAGPRLGRRPEREFVGRGGAEGLGGGG